MIVVNFVACGQSFSAHTYRKTPKVITSYSIRKMKEVHPLDKLLQKRAVDLTESDFKLLFQTPILELCNLLEFPIPSIRDEWMLGRTVESNKIEGLFLNGGYTSNLSTEYPTSFFIFNLSNDKEEGVIPIGNTFENIKNNYAWESIEETKVLYAMGYSGDDATPLEALSCKKNEIAYLFTIEYNNVFKPQNEHILIADLVEISLIK